MSPNLFAGTVRVPVSIKPAGQCGATWPRVFSAAGWRVFGKRCTQSGARRREWLIKHEEHVFAFQQLDETTCSQELQLPQTQVGRLLDLLHCAGLLQR